MAVATAPIKTLQPLFSFHLVRSSLSLIFPFPAIFFRRYPVTDSFYRSITRVSCANHCYTSASPTPLSNFSGNSSCRYQFCCPAVPPPIPSALPKLNNETFPEARSTEADAVTEVKLEGDINQGVAYYKKALYYNWHYADAMYNLGVAYGKMLKFDIAIVFYELAFHFNPHCAEACNNLGVIYKDRDNLDKAVECYQVALSIKPNFSQSLNNLGVVYTVQGKMDAAASMIEKAIVANPTYAEAYNNLGKWLGNRQIRCNWATKGAGANDDKQSSDAKSVVELTNGSSEDGKEMANSDGPENNPQYTTIYVGNLAPEVSQVDLHRHFHALGAGVIEEVRVQRDKGFGFVRYSSHAEAALAIQMGNTQSLLCGKQIKCSWGSKPTPPGTSSNPLPPPAAAQAVPGLSAADLLAYERQLAMSKMGGVHALMHPQGQHPLKLGAAGASQAIYDGGFQNVAAQQLMYYQ